jgi:hypothetical protein
LSKLADAALLKESALEHAPLVRRQAVEQLRKQGLALGLIVHRCQLEIVGQNLGLSRGAMPAVRE